MAEITMVIVQAPLAQLQIFCHIISSEGKKKLPFTIEFFYESYI